MKKKSSSRFNFVQELTLICSSDLDCLIRKLSCLFFYSFYIGRKQIKNVSKLYKSSKLDWTFMTAVITVDSILNQRVPLPPPLPQHSVLSVWLWGGRPDDSNAINVYKRVCEALNQWGSAVILCICICSEKANPW